MSKTVELTDETYAAIAARAAQVGVTPEKLLEMEYVPIEPAPPKPGETLYDRFKDYLGKFEGKTTTASQDTGKQFADYLEQKRREGRL
jgi:hypothetical protein